MKPYLVSLALGMLVGVIYALFSVRSPAPPIIALVGPARHPGRRAAAAAGQAAARAGPRRTRGCQHQVKPHMFGELPQCAKPVDVAAADTAAAQRDTP